MAATYTNITQQEFEEFLEINPETGQPNELSEKNFYRLSFKGTKELVYGKVVQPGITLRIYSSIVPGSGSRASGEDAIRCTLWWAPKNAEPKLVGAERIVKRTQNWQLNLSQRIEGWQEQLGSPCSCGAPTVRRQRKQDKGYFFGCVLWPHCPKKVVVEMKKEELVPISVSQLYYLITSAMYDPKMPLHILCEVAKILYGNQEAFKLTSNGIQTLPSVKEWLPKDENLM